MITFLTAVATKAAIDAFIGGAMLGSTLYVASRSGKVSRRRVKR